MNTHLLTYLVVLGVLAGGGYAETYKRPVPRKDKEIAELLQTGKKSDAFIEKLAQIDRRRLTGALAWELSRPELRTQAMQFLSKKGSYDSKWGSYNEVTPYVVVSLKWSKGADRMMGLRVVGRFRAKEAVPVILTHVLDDPYKETRTIMRESENGPRLPCRTIITGDLGYQAISALGTLTDRKIDSKPTLEDLRAMAMGLRRPPPPSQEQKQQWRAWWKKNGKNLLPQVAMPQARFQTEKEVRQWLKARLDFFGEEMAKDARKDVDAFLGEASPLGNAGGDLYHANIPRTVIGPVRTAVLVAAVLDSSGKGAKPTDVGLRRHRKALVALSRSVDYPEITSLLLWAQNGRLLDMQATAYCLGEMRDDRTVGLLEKILNEKPDRATRYSVANALGKTDQPATAKLLVQVLATDKSTRFSSTIYEALRGLAGRGPMQEKAVVEALCPLLDNQDAKVVNLALGVLANTSSTVALAAVEKALPKFDGKLKVFATRVLSLIRDNIESGGLKR